MPETRFFKARAMSLSAQLCDLQHRQRAHDIAYHPDIWQLPPARSLTHMTLHQTKYMGALAAALASGDRAAQTRAITDAFVIVLATANLLNQDLSALTSAAPRGGFTELACAFARADGMAAFEPGLIVTRHAALCGRMAKACEAFDHAEDYPSRKALAECNAELFRLVVTLAGARNIDLAAAYDARINAVEAKSIFRPAAKETAAPKGTAAAKPAPKG